MTRATAGCAIDDCQETFNFSCAREIAETTHQKRTTEDRIDEEHKKEHSERETGKQEHSCSDTHKEWKGKTTLHTNRNLNTGRFEERNSSANKGSNDNMGNGEGSSSKTKKVDTIESCSLSDSDYRADQLPAASTSSMQTQKAAKRKLADNQASTVRAKNSGGKVRKQKRWKRKHNPTTASEDQVVHIDSDSSNLEESINEKQKTRVQLWHSPQAATADESSNLDDFELPCISPVRSKPAVGKKTFPDASSNVECHNKSQPQTARMKATTPPKGSSADSSRVNVNSPELAASEKSASDRNVTLTERITTPDHMPASNSTASSSDLVNYELPALDPAHTRKQRKRKEQKDVNVPSTDPNLLFQEADEAELGQYAELSSLPMKTENMRSEAFATENRRLQTEIEDVLEDHDLACGSNPGCPDAKQSMGPGVEDDVRQTVVSDDGVEAMPVPIWHAFPPVQLFDASMIHFTQADQKCVLAIPQDAKQLMGPAVAHDVWRTVVSDYDLEAKHVHLWHAPTSVLLPAACMIYFFEDIATVWQNKEWHQLQQLLMDANTIQKKRDEDYSEMVKRQEKLIDHGFRFDVEDMITTKERLIVELLRNRGDDTDRPQGKFIKTSSGVKYLCLVLDHVSDSDHILRNTLHVPPALYQWTEAQSVPASFDVMSPGEIESSQSQEISVLKNWFCSSFNQAHKIIDLPDEEILRYDPSEARNSNYFALLKSNIEECENPGCECELPVIVFFHRINSNVVYVQKYLQAYLRKHFAEFNGRRLISVFHLKDLDGEVEGFADFDLGMPDCQLNLLSTFDPSEKPICFVIAEVERKYKVI